LVRSDFRHSTPRNDWAQLDSAGAAPIFAAIIFKRACALGCEGIVSKRLGSPYRAGRTDHWTKVKNPAAPAVKCEAEEDWSTLGKRLR
jgi:hypothetical protein